MNKEEALKIKEELDSVLSKLKTLNEQTELFTEAKNNLTEVIKKQIDLVNSIQVVINESKNILGDKDLLVVGNGLKELADQVGLNQATNEKIDNKISELDKTIVNNNTTFIENFEKYTVELTKNIEVIKELIDRKIDLLNQQNSTIINKIDMLTTTSNNIEKEMQLIKEINEKDKNIIKNQKNIIIGGMITSGIILIFIIVGFFI